MPFKATEFIGLFLYEPEVFTDSRGFFFESYNQRKLELETGFNTVFVQDNHSKSSYGTLRGLHFQKEESAQAKLVRVLSGMVLDVVVDLRKGSPTFRQSFSIELSAQNKRQLLVPRGFAHGFIVLSESAEFFYKCDNYYDPQAEGGIHYADEELNIDWKLPDNMLILSDKDRKLPFLKDL
jgi:dTDP-4-dehydrorhamnose 3,5-epimerase